MTKKKKLTDKQEQFCLEYVVDFNATRAAIAAGYSKKTAKTIGAQNLSKVNIAERVKELKKPKQQKPKDMRQRIIDELAAIAFANADDFFEDVYVEDEDTGEQRFSYRQIKPDILKSEKIAAISSFEPGAYGTKLKVNNKLDALEKLARHHGLYNADTTNKPEVNQYDFSNISSDKLRKIQDILKEDE